MTGQPPHPAAAAEAARYALIRRLAPSMRHHLVVNLQPIGMIYEVMDRRLRAFDVRTGRVLWSDTLPDSAQATPMSYVSPQTGQQFVVITVPSSSGTEVAHTAEPEANRTDADVKTATDSGGWVIAYALKK